MRLLTFLSVIFVLGVSPAAVAQEMTVDEIVSKANIASYYAGQDGFSDVSMTITDSQGRERVRKFRILRLNIEKGAEQKFYVYFHEPSDVSRMVYMVWKHIGRDDDRWLYLPALDLVRRIAASDKRSSFVGSHFVYEDVSGRSPEADVHELLETTGQSYKIRNTPKDDKGVEFAYYDVWIDRENFMPTKAEYYDAKGDLIRSIEAEEIKEIKGYPTVTRSVARDIQRNGQTVMEFDSIDYDVGLSDDIFTERYLRRPPVQWTRK